MYFHIQVNVTIVHKNFLFSGWEKIFKNQLYQIHEQKIKMTSIIYK